MFLLPNGACITKLAFLSAARSEDLAIFQEFLNYGWDINSTEFGEPALRYRFLPCCPLILVPDAIFDRLIVGNETCVVGSWSMVPIPTNHMIEVLPLLLLHHLNHPSPL